MNKPLTFAEFKRAYKEGARRLGDFHPEAAADLRRARRKRQFTKFCFWCGALAVAGGLLFCLWITPNP